MAEQKQRVLFVCGHNAGRSICAEAICRQLRPDIEVALADVVVIVS